MKPQWSKEQLAQLRNYNWRRSSIVLVFWFLVGLPLLMVWSHVMVNPHWLDNEVGLGTAFHLSKGAAAFMDSWWGGFTVGAFFVSIFSWMGHGIEIW